MGSVKAVIYVEYKRTFSSSHARKKRQFEKFGDLLRAHFPADEGWRLVTSYGFAKWPEAREGEEESSRPCEKCRDFVFMVSDFEGMKAWFDNSLSKLDRGGKGDIRCWMQV